MILKKWQNQDILLNLKKKIKKGEKLIVEVTKIIYDNTCKDSLPNLWIKNGYTKHLYNTAIHIETFCCLENGDCVSKYNPTHKLSDGKKRYIINFDNLLEITKENETKLINKIYNLFMNC